VSTTSKRSRQRSASSLASMEASNGARVAKARATGVKDFNDRRGEVFIRRISSWRFYCVVPSNTSLLDAWHADAVLAATP
jgi:hypothetical protein